MSFTTLDNLYDVLCALSLKVTGRATWQKAGIQAMPVAPYATVYIAEGQGMSYDVVQVLQFVTEEGIVLQEFPWGNTRLSVEVEFFKDSMTVSASNDATIFKNSLRLTDREWDLWTVCGFAGDLRIVDMSQIFRADAEPRVKVLFSLYANIIPASALIGSTITDINQFDLTVNGNTTTIVNPEINRRLQHGKSPS